MLQQEFGFDAMIHWEYHTAPPYNTSEGIARANWYGVSGIPDVRIDGIYREIGGGDGCEGAAARYRVHINNRLNATGGVSPVSIDGDYLPLESTMPVEATFRLEDPVSLTSLRATLLIYENDLSYGGDHYDYIMRDLYDQNITLTNVGDEVTVSTVFNVSGAWNIDNLRAVAYLQKTTTKEIIQGAYLPIGDFNVEYASRIAAVPSGSGDAMFEGILTNVSDEIDTYTLQIGNTFGDWPAEFRVCGDPNWHTAPVQVELGPDDTCDFAVRVATDDVIEKRIGTFEVTSDWSNRTVTEELRVFNGSWAILFVDDDRDRADEVPLLAALDASSCLYDDWDIWNDHGDMSPTASYMADYDIVYWHHSWWPSTTPLTEGDVNALMSFVDNGGSLFLTSQLFLKNPAGPASFRMDYLGVLTYTLDPDYLELNGVAGDPIGDGLYLPLEFPFGAVANGDAFTPTAAATSCMTEPVGGMTVTAANDLEDAGKVVFMSVAFNAVSADDPDPNNLTVVTQRIMDWLAPVNPADVDEPVIALLGSRIDGARPNPFNPRTEIDFRLSRAGAAGPVQVEIFDLAGRKVANLFDGTLTAGPHTVTWTGTSDRGQPVESGAYFVRLSTLEGRSSEKLILLK